MKSLNELKRKLQKITLSQSVYPMLSVALLILIVILFTTATRTISTLVNDTVNEQAPQTNPYSVDRESFLIVAKKLGITTETNNVQSIPITAPATTTPKVQPL